MSKTYYYEIHQRIQESERNEGTIAEDTESDKLHNENKLETTFGGEQFLSDYEIINNDEFEDEIVDLTSKRYERAGNSKISNFHFTNVVEPKNFRLNLNSTKISLKSQNSRINKSILSEKENAAEIKNSKRAPLSFTIEPLMNEPKQTKIHANSNDSNESNNLPEIVLNSFEMRDNVKMKKSATVTFLTTTTATTVSNSILRSSPSPSSSPLEMTSMLNNAPSIDTKNIPILPAFAKAENNLHQQESYQLNNSSNNNAKSATATNPPNTTTAIVEVHNTFRRDSEDSSEFYSLHGGGNSTSPESLIDTILSAASSVSVCESSTNSLTSTATDITRLGFNISVDSPRLHTVKELDIHRLDGVGVGDDYVSINIKTKTTTTTTSTTTVTTATGRNEMLANGSLNLKSKKVLSPATPVHTHTHTSSSLTLDPASSSLRTKVATTPISVNTPISVLRISESQSWLQPLECFEAATASSLRSRSLSPLPSPVPTIQERTLYPDELKCQICREPFNDPRTLNCLHSFCFQCLVNENFKQDKSIPFWSQPNESNPSTANANEHNVECKNSVNYSFRSLSPETTVLSCSESSSSPSKHRRSSFSFRRKKSQDRIQFKAKSEGRASENSSTARLNTFPIEFDKKIDDENERIRFISCKICNYATELPIGGLRQLPQNFMITRKIEEIKLKAGDEIISYVFCTLCYEETNAIYHCITCTLNLCTLCKDAHERQRTTANHKIKNIIELRRVRRKQQSMLDELAKFTLKCGMHPDFEIKSFCTICLQVACADCLVLLHKGHKHETISKAIGNYSKLLNVSVELARPLTFYAEHTIERLSAISNEINRKCDEVQASVEAFMQQYVEALEVHRKTLLQQVNRARESKIEILLEQQMDMEKRSNETVDAIRFCQELRDSASDVELLSFVNILLKRFEYCQQFKSPIDPKISDSLHFFPKITAPSTKEQNDITLYGIITMQIVEPTLCTLQVEGFNQLRLHKRVEMQLLTRDADGVPLCHGGMLRQIQISVKYKESNGKDLPFELSDNRDGTYIIAFTPDSQGTLIINININDKPIKGSPYTFAARALRPHSGIYHCCSFCSSGRNRGNKAVKCSCEGRMPGYVGCGHGHAGHPGRRHWSCCGNVLQNSECNVANKLLS